MTEKLLDSSAVLASLNGEPGGDLIDAVAIGSHISAINLAEVISKLILGGLSPADAFVVAQQCGAETIEVDEGQAILAGEIHARSRSAGLSMANAFCLALAKQRRFEVLTSDRAWKTLDLGVEVTLIR
jgi:PIN domain nuclease of toxin-antitoxin system